MSISLANGSVTAGAEHVWHARGVGRDATSGSKKLWCSREEQEAAAGVESSGSRAARVAVATLVVATCSHHAAGTAPLARVHQSIQCLARRHAVTSLLGGKGTHLHASLLALTPHSTPPSAT